MRWLLIFVTIGLALSLSSPVWSWSKEEIVQRIQIAYENLDTFKAVFIQETYIRSAKKVLREEGKVYFRRPSLMRWDYISPKEKQIYVSSKKSWLFLPQDRVAYVKEGDGVLSSHTVARFFAGAGRIEEDFSVMVEGSEGEIRLTLKPREKSPSLKTLKITVSSPAFVISSCRFLDDYGNEVTIRFKDMEINIPLEQKLFLFTPPPGVAVNPM
ncbi:MAG: outer membrane lipoprotein carrier protein LolA [Syntrophales bacterium]|nr:outer membrane lipoprotein carrier protein LolA [Syntrophales bacterium]